MIDKKSLIKALEKEIELSKKHNMPQMESGLIQALEVVKSQPELATNDFDMFDDDIK